ncbi:MAG: hypothetical protein FJ280_03340 [Planctomycetes bacterium]|nr:hypothetical protein [Planctomycetota bacterium]
MKARSLFTEPPPSSLSYPAYRYGMLVVILLLLAGNLRLYLSLPPGYIGDPYMNSVVVLMLFFNHLAYSFA